LRAIEHALGAAALVASMATPGIALADEQPQTMIVTGYTINGYTASGVHTHPGSAACPRWLPLGTQVDIEGIGTVTCEDRYPAGARDHFDVWVPTLAQARALTGWYTWRED
jgi:3D (Asp-Asp-Asp) domain-containing protein